MNNMEFLLLVLPLLIIIFLLVRKQHMLVAAFIGGALAIILGRLDAVVINKLFTEGITKMLGMTVPILYAATASMVTKAGSINSVVNLANHYFKGRIAILAGFMVLIQGVATLMSGLASSNSIVIAPLVFAAFGAVPEVIAGMTIVSAVAFSTTPVSGHAVVAAQMAKIDIFEYFSLMQPIVALFFVIGIGIAVFGVLKRGTMFKGTGSETSENAAAAEDATDSVNQMWIKAVPFIALLIMAVFGSNINKLIHINIFTPAINVIITVILTMVCAKFSPREASDALVDGSRIFLVTLFSVGLFLGFINMIGEIGTFVAIANLVNNVPQVLVVPIAILIGYLLAIPVGALSTAVAALILPTLAAIGLSPLALARISHDRINKNG
ncbi:putative integral membrane protein (plasmid) [Paenarthrobacter aurescens TC1]|uniref:Dicarboxylate carrier protein n=3 Tax=cellular organisms TaxID=131567 RepID=Q6SKC2_PAEAU|nr:putative transporter [Pseudomonas sp. ADP]AAS20050.1 dicarboxylate carrier protein [Paenarthrobacter aurescens]ABM10526.1 putative integral membrane protein [Paenarthrobacter aurescens TC1]